MSKLLPVYGEQKVYANEKFRALCKNHGSYRAIFAKFREKKMKDRVTAADRCDLTEKVVFACAPSLTCACCAQCT